MITIDPLLLLPLLVPLAFVWYLSRTYDPQHLSGQLVRCWTAGVLALAVWNLLPLPHLGVNSLAAVTAGKLGLPGLGLLAVVSLL